MYRKKVYLRTDFALIDLSDVKQENIDWTSPRILVTWEPVNG